MATVTYETRRQPPILLRVFAFGLINMLGIWVAGEFNWLSYNNSFWTLLFAALLLAFFNIIIKPFMMILSIPFIIFTFGLFIAVVNAFMLWLTSIFIPHFDLFTFWNTVGAAIILSICNLLMGGIMRDFIEKPQLETYEID
jgi:putative membrane protein